MDALDHLRRAEVPMLLVHDEYGHFEGIVTPADLLSAIAGEFASDQDIGSEPALVQRDDGSLLVSGQMSAAALAERLGDRRSVVEGKSVSVRLDIGGHRIIKKIKKTK